MKIFHKSLFLLSLFAASGFLHGQSTGLPDFFLKEIQNKPGTWIADNSAYKSEGEPIDASAIHWQVGPLNNELFGRLYGLKNGIETGTYWSFHQFYDPATMEVRLMQIGWDGTLGVGPLIVEGQRTEIQQVFTSPEGKRGKEGHRSEMLNDSTEVGTSYSIDVHGVWSEKRTYTWKKQAK